MSLDLKAAIIFVIIFTSEQIDKKNTSDFFDPYQRCLGNRVVRFILNIKKTAYAVFFYYAFFSIVSAARTAVRSQNMS